MSFLGYVKWQKQQAGRATIKRARQPLLSACVPGTNGQRPSEERSLPAIVSTDPWSQGLNCEEIASLG